MVCDTHQTGLSNFTEPKKKIVSIMVGTFKNKHSGEIAKERHAEKYEDGSWCHSVYDGSVWEKIDDEEKFV